MTFFLDTSPMSHETVEFNVILPQMHLALDAIGRYRLLLHHVLHDRGRYERFSIAAIPFETNDHQRKSLLAKTLEVHHRKLIHWWLVVNIFDRTLCLRAHM